MSEIHNLTEAQVILLAIHLTSDANIESLYDLWAQRTDVLKIDLVYRILLSFLPESEAPQKYTPLLKALNSRSSGCVPLGDSIDIAIAADLSPSDAHRQVRELHLKRLRNPGADGSTEQVALTSFLIQRAYQIDAATNDLQTILHLIEPFVDQSACLRKWLISNLLPLLRLDYEYYPDARPALSLNDLAQLTGCAGVKTLLQFTGQDSSRTHVGRDLRAVIGPWISGVNPSKRRKLDHTEHEDSSEHSTEEGNEVGLSTWEDVNEWLLSTSQTNFSLAAKTVLEWGGPCDVDLGGYEIPEQHIYDGNDITRYAQTAISIIYSCQAPSEMTLYDCQEVVTKVAQLSGVARPVFEEASIPRQKISIPLSSLVGVSTASVLHNALLQPENALTIPSPHSIDLITGLLLSIRILQKYKSSISPRAALEICLFGSEDTQMQQVRKVLQQITRSGTSGVDWRSVREQLNWLQTWGSDKSNTTEQEQSMAPCALFGRIGSLALENEILGALLTANQYDTAVEIYVRTSVQPLSRGALERSIVKAILNSYDNASNGNKTRGGMKRACDILKAFQPHFPQSSSIRELECLVAATHSLSFYHLILDHGVPFQPVRIRVHEDPLSLLGKVLDQNPNAYTQLDDLLSIGRNLVGAGLPVPIAQSDENAVPTNMESKMSAAEHQITYLAIISALSSNDFDTAYSYILTRLSPSLTTATHNSSELVDDTSWRAAYAASRCRPRSESKLLAWRIANLSKRMELLSLALTLAPTAEPLSEMLGAWRRGEAEMNRLRSQEAEEESAWDDRGDGLVPGGFASESREIDIEDTQREREKRASIKRTARHEDAPMGLFDVARGAARALGKGAFPLRAASSPMQIKDQIKGAQQRGSVEEEDRVSIRSEEQRVRKRDMVSNMVTGGLVSGLGWVLGTQPVNNGRQP